VSDVAALASTIREALTAMASADSQLRRFGAADHRYALAAPLEERALVAIEQTLDHALPGDLRLFAAAIGSGGAGPYRGWLPIDRTARFIDTAPRGVTSWTRALPVAHMGCGYAAVVVLDGAARGEVWIDARSIDVVAPMRTTFTAYYLDWIDRVSRAEWPEAFVPPNACALASALGGYLAHRERELGLDPGAIAGDLLREALAQLGPGAIEIAAEEPYVLFDRGDRVDPCIACARLIESLAADGLRADVISRGAQPRPLR
jgi:hypothetical protein